MEKLKEFTEEMEKLKQIENTFSYKSIALNTKEVIESIPLTCESTKLTGRGFKVTFISGYIPIDPKLV